MPQIHATAIVSPKAEIAADVEVGPYCIVDEHVVLEEGVRLESHVVVTGRTRIGAKGHVFPFASIGHRPMDMKYKGEPSRLEIGRNATIREYVTMNPGTEGGGMLTAIGDNCLFMTGSHVAHDCIIADNVILVSNATLGGHVVLEEFVIVGGLAAVHQFVRIGKHAMIGGMSGVEQDVIPYGSVMGNRAHLSGLNLVGLKRCGFARDDIHTLRTAYRLLFAQEGTLQERLADVGEMFSSNTLVQDVVAFVRNASSRGVCQPQLEGDVA